MSDIAIEKSILDNFTCLKCKRVGLLPREDSDVGKCMTCGYEYSFEFIKNYRKSK